MARFAVPAIKRGRRRITVRATDAAGNRAQASKGFKIPKPKPKGRGR